ncbi:prion-inhibition and propagation-domain-containing protein [Apiospora arundinis]|uniref:Prion-inhibition and propagation-domain-containing protein n=1 Tax=Apiospora arundinis TaxID=335852 RepID=A0ABR2JAV3_9PEZI
MAEAVGTALAVVGVLGQIFDGCVKAYGHFTTAAQFAEQSRGLACKLRIEEMRLVVWGRAWGVTEGKLEAHLMDAYGGSTSPTTTTARTTAAAVGPGILGGEGPGGVMMRSLAVQILSELHRTITDGQKLRERYGLEDEAEKGSSGDSNSSTKWATGRDALVKRPSDHGKKEGTGGGDWSWRKEFSIRARWVVADKDKFTALLTDLKDYNDGLEQLFPASRIPAIQRTWVAELLQSAKRDVEQLSLLENASNEVYPKLNASANLKRLRINLDNEPHSKAAFKPTFAFKVARTTLTVADRDPKRSEGLYQRNDNKSESSSNVLIEWVDYDREDLDEKFVHLRRLDQLARMMASATDRHPDLHTIDCLGYTDDTANSRYGLVYKAPGKRPTAEAAAAAATTCCATTLHALISSNDLKTPDLNERVRLAQTLAVALWSLHSLDWLHKSLCSNNILFFPAPSTSSSAEDTTTASTTLVPDISSPYLVGFDASRPDMDTDMSVASKNPSILDLHRHPKSLSGLARRPYCKSYDVYSLGLVLLEIGLWKSLQTYYKPHYSAERWRDRVVLPVLVPGLGNRTGRVYREVVERCLTAGDDISGEEAGQLMESVVAALESIHV